MEGWAELALTTFLYLEWYRVQQMSRRDLSDKEKRWWQHQRTYGLCQAVRLATEQNGSPVHRRSSGNAGRNTHPETHYP